MLQASTQTLMIFFFTLLFGLPLGLLIAAGRMTKFKIIQWPVRFFLLIMRGTPLILQLFLVYFGPSLVLGIRYKNENARLIAAIVAFVLNYGAYFAEIYRSGLEGIPKGQKEAAVVLGFSRWQTFYKIILPQVIKRILPPMGSEFMTLIKDTALAMSIGVPEIYQLATSKMSTTASFIPLLMAGVFYLIMNAVVSRGFNLLEKKMDYYN
ncbi:MAG TPA: amino acid ABC transporter permease [Candidatus Merdenecus merdavium]|nr:amino acid ABC transporter permease [Candidatus Merdenecus merdavium]